MSNWRAFWEQYYAAGNISGRDSRGEAAERKAAVVNDLIAREGITSVIDWGCGDSVQASLIKCDDYLGVDLSGTAVGKCIADRPDRQYLVRDPSSSIRVQLFAELGLSMSVIYHLVDPTMYERYITKLFGSADRFVCVFCTDVERPQRDHLRHHQWTTDVPPHWELVEFVPWDDGDSKLGHYIYRRRDAMRKHVR